jgi:hypothetical protein
MKIFINPIKAIVWRLVLEEILNTGRLTPVDAAKMAGRLIWSTSWATDKVGRAWVKPFHAQALSPMLNNIASPWLKAAAQFWISYIKLQPMMYRTLSEWQGHRPSVYTWGDAAGVSRWIASVICVDKCWKWCRWLCPQSLWDQLLYRENKQINVQELLSIVLTVYTFQNDIKGRLWCHWCDNDGITATMLQGSACSGDVNQITGKVWLKIASLRSALHLERVESLANVADGPTRDSFKHLEDLKATEVKPIMPWWIDNVWQPISELVL